MKKKRVQSVLEKALMRRVECAEVSERGMYGVNIFAEHI